MKILGITLAENLSMDNHIWAGQKSMVRGINTKIALLRTLKPFLKTKDLGNIGSALINSTIAYGAPIWGMTTQKNIERLQSCQTRAARLVTGRGWQKGRIKEHRQTILTQLGWQNVQQLIDSAILNMTKNSTLGQSSKGINDMFKVKNPPNPRAGQGARISHKGKITTKGKTFMLTAPNLYNKLPPELRNPNLSKEKFKGQLKTHMKTQHHLPQH